MTSVESTTCRPMVSIILPTYNRLSFLPAAVESILVQSFRDWELIIADDGSDEATAAYLRSLQNNPQIQILWRAHSGNPAAVRNAALRKARGDYVAFMDSDDVWVPSKIAQQLRSLQATADCRWGYTALADIDAFGDPVNDGNPGSRIARGRRLLEDLLRLDVDIATPSVIVERALLEEVGGFDEQQLVYEDYDLWIRLALRSDADLQANTLVFVRRHDQHYYRADMDGYTARARLLEKSLGLISEPRLRRIVNRGRARNAAGQAHALAATGASAASIRVLRLSLRFAWAFPIWWLGAARTIVRLLIQTPMAPRFRAAPDASGRTATLK